MFKPSPEAEPQFSQPIRQIMTMIAIIALVAAGGWMAHEPIIGVVMSNPYLNGVIVLVFGIGVVSCFWQVFGLISSVNWIEGFAVDRAGHEFVGAPRLLSSLATLLKSREARSQISASSSRSILDSMAARLDETREITRYIINLLISLGLLGTFYGLAITVPAVVDTIRSLAPTEGEGGVEVFGRLMTGLEKQLGGMGTAFSSSLLGLAGSLVVGLLDLFTGHGQNRFYRELEEWLSTITQVSYSKRDQSTGGTASLDSGTTEIALHQMAESLVELQKTFIQTDEVQSQTAQHLAELTQVLNRLNARLAESTAVASTAAAETQSARQSDLLARLVTGQEQMLEAISQQSDDGIDAESRMRLRSIDVQLLRILEELSAGRQDMVAELRTDISALNKAIRSLSRKPAMPPTSRPGSGD